MLLPAVVTLLGQVAALFLVGFGRPQHISTTAEQIGALPLDEAPESRRNSKQKPKSLDPIT
jgi:hypothetical protein